MSNQILTRLGLDHERIEHVLHLIEQELLKFDDDESDEDLHAIAAALEYMEAYPDAVHHPVEERLFDILEDRAEPAERQAVLTLRAQHEEITQSTRVLKQDVDSILNDIVTPIEQLLNHLQTYVTLQRDHMMVENSIAFPAASRTLDEGDWCSLETQLTTDDPMFDGANDRFNELYGRIVEDLGDTTTSSPEG